MVMFWRDVQGLDVSETPKKVTYRATNPLYANERYTIYMGEELGKTRDVSIVDSYGKVSMLGQIESFE